MQNVGEVVASVVGSMVEAAVAGAGGERAAADAAAAVPRKPDTMPLASPVSVVEAEAEAEVHKDAHANVAGAQDEGDEDSDTEEEWDGEDDESDQEEEAVELPVTSIDFVEETEVEVSELPPEVAASIAAMANTAQTDAPNPTLQREGSAEPAHAEADLAPVLNESLEGSIDSAEDAEIESLARHVSVKSGRSIRINNSNMPMSMSLEREGRSMRGASMRVPRVVTPSSKTQEQSLPQESPNCDGSLGLAPDDFSFDVEPDEESERMVEQLTRHVSVRAGARGSVSSTTDGGRRAAPLEREGRSVRGVSVRIRRTEEPELDDHDDARRPHRRISFAGQEVLGIVEAEPVPPTQSLDENALDEETEREIDALLRHVSVTSSRPCATAGQPPLGLERENTYCRNSARLSNSSLLERSDNSTVRSTQDCCLASDELPPFHSPTASPPASDQNRIGEESFVATESSARVNTASGPRRFEFSASNDSTRNKSVSFGTSEVHRFKSKKKSKHDGDGEEEDDIIIVPAPNKTKAEAAVAAANKSQAWSPSGNESARKSNREARVSFAQKANGNDSAEGNDARVSKKAADSTIGRDSEREKRCVRKRDPTPYVSRSSAQSDESDVEDEPSQPSSSRRSVGFGPIPGENKDGTRRIRKRDPTPYVSRAPDLDDDDETSNEDGSPSKCVSFRATPKSKTPTNGGRRLRKRDPTPFVQRAFLPEDEDGLSEDEESESESGARIGTKRSLQANPAASRKRDQAQHVPRFAEDVEEDALEGRVVRESARPEKRVSSKSSVMKRDPTPFIPRTAVAFEEESEREDAMPPDRERGHRSVRKRDPTPYVPRSYTDLEDSDNDDVTPRSVKFSDAQGQTKEADFVQAQYSTTSAPHPYSFAHEPLIEENDRTGHVAVNSYFRRNVIPSRLAEYRIEEEFVCGRLRTVRFVIAFDQGRDQSPYASRTDRRLDPEPLSQGNSSIQFDEAEEEERERSQRRAKRTNIRFEEPALEDSGSGRKTRRGHQEECPETAVRSVRKRDPTPYVGRYHVDLSDMDDEEESGSKVPRGSAKNNESGRKQGRDSNAARKRDPTPFVPRSFVRVDEDEDEEDESAARVSFRDQAEEQGRERRSSVKPDHASAPAERASMRGKAPNDFSDCDREDKGPSPRSRTGRGICFEDEKPATVNSASQNSGRSVRKRDPTPYVPRSYVQGDEDDDESGKYGSRDSDYDAEENSGRKVTFGEDVVQVFSRPSTAMRSRQTSLASYDASSEASTSRSLSLRSFGTLPDEAFGDTGKRVSFGGGSEHIFERGDSPGIRDSSKTWSSDLESSSSSGGCILEKRLSYEVGPEGLPPSAIQKRSSRAFGRSSKKRDPTPFVPRSFAHTDDSDHSEEDDNQNSSFDSESGKKTIRRSRSRQVVDLNDGMSRTGSLLPSQSDIGTD